VKTPTKKSVTKRRVVRTEVAPRGGRIPNKRQNDVLFEMQADHQRHEHKSTRYRETFSIIAMGLILLFGLYWASFLEKAEMAELGKYIVTTMIGTVIAYFFATRSKH
jgi:FtsH-binding integral membrane protein